MYIIILTIIPACLFAVCGFSFTALYISSLRKQENEKQRRNEEYERERLIKEAEKCNRYLQLQEERRKKKKKLCEYIRNLANSNLVITPEQFFKIKKSCNYNNIPTKNIKGVYILYNATKNLPYVGQAHNIFQRISHHFTGHGNGDLYADYKYGDSFTIQIIGLEQSGFVSLNQLEKATISAFNACDEGYNKTHGNS